MSEAPPVEPAPNLGATLPEIQEESSAPLS